MFSLNRTSSDHEDDNENEDEDLEDTCAESAEPIDFNPKEAIERLCAMDEKTAYGHRGKSGFNIEKLKSMAVFLNIKKSQSKKELISAIIARARNEAALKTMIIGDKENFTPISAVAKGFRKDKNTFPRICNILMSMPDQLHEVFAISSRQSLQLRQTHGKNLIWITAEDRFNDPDLNTGGNVAQDDLILRDIDPESVRRKGSGVVPITAEYIYVLFKEVLHLHAAASVKFERSGNHGHSFYNFCQNRLDVYYLHVWLTILDNPQLTKFCREGSEISCGFESRCPLNAARATVATPSRSSADSALTMLAATAASSTTADFPSSPLPQPQCSGSSLSTPTLLQKRQNSIEGDDAMTASSNKRKTGAIIGLSQIAEAMHKRAAVSEAATAAAARLAQAQEVACAATARLAQIQELQAREQEIEASRTRYDKMSSEIEVMKASPDFDENSKTYKLLVILRDRCLENIGKQTGLDLSDL